LAIRQVASGGVAIGDGKVQSTVARASFLFIEQTRTRAEIFEKPENELGRANNYPDIKIYNLNCQFLCLFTISQLYFFPWIILNIKRRHFYPVLQYFFNLNP